MQKPHDGYDFCRASLGVRPLLHRPGLARRRRRARRRTLLALAAPAAQLRSLDRTTTVALAEALARGIELTGMAVMVVGGAAALVAFLVRLIQRRRRSREGEGVDTAGGGGCGDFEPTYRDLRADLGRAILLGLEFLVAADIIGTVAVAPTFANLGVLALIVVIRTFLSFSLELEISGRWPWQPVVTPSPPPASGDKTGPPAGSA